MAVTRRAATSPPGAPPISAGSDTAVLGGRPERPGACSTRGEMMAWPALSRASLHVTSRVFDGHDRSMATIDHELEKAERTCPVSSCAVTLSGDRRGGFRATVALELEGGRSVSQCSWGHDMVHAIVQAFTVCRLRGAAAE